MAEVRRQRPDDGDTNKNTPTGTLLTGFPKITRDFDIFILTPVFRLLTSGLCLPASVVRPPSSDFWLLTTDYWLLPPAPTQQGTRPSTVTVES